MHQSRRRQQSGMALLVTLVLIALMALLAFSGSEVTRLQQRLASNDQAAQIAFQAAEAALHEAIVEIKKSDSAVGFCGYMGSACITTEKPFTVNIHDRLEKGQSVDFELGDGTGIVMSEWPRYTFIHDKSEACSMVGGEKCYNYLIYAQGFGPNGQISRIIEARYVPK